jgi:hypothetical protein
MAIYRRDSKNDTINEAMKLIDPSGTLVPGTDEYDTIKDMLAVGIDVCGPDYALHMAKRGS